MRILVIEGVASPTFGGAEKSMSSFCDYLRHLNDDVFLVCETYHDSYGVPKDKAMILNLQPFQNQGLNNYFKTIKSISKFIKAHQIDLVITHCIHAMPLLRLVKFRTGTPLMVYFKWVFNQSNIGTINTWGLKGFDSYVAINEFVGNYWKSQLNHKTNFEFVPDGVEFLDEPEFDKSRSEKNDILYFGRIFRGKGLHLLLEALSKLGNAYKLTVLGDFSPNDSRNNELDYHKYIENQVKELNIGNKVNFVGLVDNVVPFIKKASLVVVPSIIDDAQPFSVLESFANGCPAIGTNKGGIPYLFQKDEFWYCEPESDILANKILSIMSLSSSELAEKTKIRYEDLRIRYNKSKTENILREICKSLIS
jgi:glycosyltransferase involved in cell wall biosynthesis